MLNSTDMFQLQLKPGIPDLYGSKDPRHQLPQNPEPVFDGLKGRQDTENYGHIKKTQEFT